MKSRRFKILIAFLLCPVFVLCGCAHYMGYHYEDGPEETTIISQSPSGINLSTVSYKFNEIVLNVQNVEKVKKKGVISEKFKTERYYKPTIEYEGCGEIFFGPILVPFALIILPIMALTDTAATDPWDENKPPYLFLQHLHQTITEALTTIIPGVTYGKFEDRKTKRKKIISPPKTRTFEECVGTALANAPVIFDLGPAGMKTVRTNEKGICKLDLKPFLKQVPHGSIWKIIAKAEVGDKKEKHEFTLNVSLLGNQKLAEIQSSKGTYTYNDRQYVGEFRYGKKHGKGTLTWFDGDEYVGEFKNGLLDGKGTLTWTDGQVYSGEHQNGLKHGHGTYIWANGNKFKGEWKEGKRHGKGTHYYTDGRVEYGIWKKSKLEKAINKEDIKTPIVAKTYTLPYKETADLSKTTETLSTIQNFAVIIGISRYKDTRIPSLRYAAADAKSFYDWLVSPSSGKYAPSRVKLLLDEDATGEKIKNALFVWLNKALEEDVVTIYFAGHGSPSSPDTPENLFFLPYDTKYNDIASTGFPMWDIETALQRFIKAKKVVVIADACHAGGVGKSFDIARRANRDIHVNPISSGLQNLSKIGDGVCVITASEDNQYSQESKEWGGGHGVFTYFLMKGLEGEADYIKDNRVTLGELIPYVSQNVRRATRNAQSPTVAGKYDPALSIGR